MRECPMCGEQMRQQSHEVVTRVPGTSQETKKVEREWVCPECDYFEEDDSPAVNPDAPTG